MRSKVLRFGVWRLGLVVGFGLGFGFGFGFRYEFRFGFGFSCYGKAFG